MKWEIDKAHPLTPEYEAWVDDCHIYALLHGSNNCTAMRNVLYKGQTHNIHNNFFWLTRQEAINLYYECGATELEMDAIQNPIPHPGKTHAWEIAGDPYLAHVLPTLNLSGSAKEVLELLKKIHVQTIPLRKGADAALHLNAWDAGVYQLRKLAKNTSEWDELTQKFKVLEKQLADGVYKFGFLRR